MVKNKTILLVFRLVLGGLFVYAGAVKALAPLDFAQSIRNYQIAGQSLSFVAALVLPWLEILAGAFLIAGVWKRGAALVISGLLVFFIALTIVTVARGLDVECGCFGPIDRQSPHFLLAREHPGKADIFLAPVDAVRSSHQRHDGGHGL